MASRHLHGCSAQWRSDGLAEFSGGCVFCHGRIGDGRMGQTSAPTRRRLNWGPFERFACPAALLGTKAWSVSTGEECAAHPNLIEEPPARHSIDGDIMRGDDECAVGG
jgi:hypothetical protein